MKFLNKVNKKFNELESNLKAILENVSKNSQKSP